MTRPPRLTPRRVLGHGAAAFALSWRAAPGGTLAEFGGALVGGVAPVAAAWLVKLVLDDLAGAAPDQGRVLVLAAALAATATVGVLLPQVTRYLDAELTRRVTRLVRERLFAAVNRLAGLARLEDPRFHDRLQLAQQSGHIGPGELSGGLLQVLQGTLALTGFTASLVLLNPALAALVVAAAAPTLWAELRLGRARAAAFLRFEQRERRELFYAHLLSGVEAAKEVRLFGLGAFFGARMLRELDAAHAEHRGLDRRLLRAQLSLGLLGAAAAGVAIWYAVAAAYAGRLTPGDVALVLASIPGVQGGLAAVVSQTGRVQQALLLFDHYRAVESTEPDLPVPAAPRAAPKLRHGVEFRDVWFRYSPEHPWVLRGVDLEIPAGSSVGLVGLNGAGKSTVVKLLCRFYDPSRGSVTWDGVDLRELDPVDLRARIGAVFQDYMEYDLSAAENIAVADLPVLDERGRIEAAARDAGLHAALSALPRGYDTLLTRLFFDDDGEQADPASGVVLSGGQWQRMAVARGFLRADRDLLILDEPSAGLDAEAEHDLHVRLMELRRGRTSLLISHRLGAVRAADLIVVLADGRITERGSHDDLVGGGGDYARLFALQARGYAPPMG